VINGQFQRAASARRDQPPAQARPRCTSTNHLDDRRVLIGVSINRSFEGDVA
jgi:hypothetical protein